MNTRLDRKFLELRLLTQDLGSSEAFESTLKVIRLAIASAKVNDAVVSQIMEQLEAPTLKTRVLTEKEPLMKMAALWRALYEALESVGGNDEVVKEWLDQYRFIYVNAAPPTTAFPPYPGEAPPRLN